MKQIDCYFPGIHPGILPNEAEPDGYCSPKESFEVNGGYVVFLSDKLYGYIVGGTNYIVYITKESGYLIFTEEEFNSFFVKKGSGH